MLTVNKWSVILSVYFGICCLIECVTQINRVIVGKEASLSSLLGFLFKSNDFVFSEHRLPFFQSLHLDAV